MVNCSKGEKIVNFSSVWWNIMFLKIDKVQNKRLFKIHWKEHVLHVKLWTCIPPPPRHYLKVFTTPEIHKSRHVSLSKTFFINGCRSYDVNSKFKFNSLLLYWSKLYRNVLLAIIYTWTCTKYQIVENLLLTSKQSLTYRQIFLRLKWIK